MSVTDGDDAAAEDRPEQSGTDGLDERHDLAESTGDAPEVSGDADRTGDSQSFGWRGWVVVGTLVVSLVVVPWSIVYLPQAQEFLESLGLGLRDAYLVLPLVPAFGLGVVAVWAAVANRRTS